MTTFFQRLLGSRRTGAFAVALTIAGLATITTAGASLDRLLEPLRFGLLSRAASGQIVVVEMDAASAAAINRWPWPRVNYARVVDRLRHAGAASIAFDVDLSSPSSHPDDEALAAALARADGLVALPTFSQAAGASDRRSLDTMPIALLRPHVALASVSILPDADGLVREAPLGTMTYGLPRPSLSALLAKRSGTANDSFPIDFGIVPATIPRLSFVAVRDGRFDPDRVRGRAVVIGATAIEMGDRYAVPRWGYLPGVIVQALGAETLMRGAPHEGGWVVPFALATALALIIARQRRLLALVAASVGAVLVLAALLIAAQALGYCLPAGGALILIVSIASGCIAIRVADRLREQRTIDEDTALPNRRALLHSLRAGQETSLLVAFVANLDSMAAVLPTGSDHQLVRRLAERLQFAASEPVHRVADRMLAVQLVAETDVAALAERLRPVLLAPIEIAGRRVDAMVSVATHRGAAPLADMLALASLAAEEAARAGVFWRPKRLDLAAIDQHISLLGELDRAIAAHEITVAYQPKLALETNRIVSAEALVRWRTPNGESISPALFVGLAEQAGRMGPLTRYVLARVLADLGGWLAAGHDLTVAVNISATLLGEEALDREILELIAGSTVPANRLVFEVTESATIGQIDAAVRSLRRYHAAGVSISMDDYGTGQSTLSYLRQLPLSELKIDRAFVQHVATDSRDRAMVQSTVALAHQLGLKVVAEGAEDVACVRTLRQLGCDFVQGYVVSRPVSAEDFVKLPFQRQLEAA